MHVKKVAKGGKERVVRQERISGEAVYDFENLYQAFLAAKKEKGHKPEVLRFEASLWQQLALIQEDLRQQTYKVGQYRVFTIAEPKKRVIMALPFRDRVIHHALCQVIRPRLEKHFVTANAANRTGKGTHYAIRLFTAQLKHLHEHNDNAQGKAYCLKGDIAGFFYNIDRQIMKEKLRRLFRDPAVWWLLELIVDSSPDIKDETGKLKVGKGLPIGNLTSQFFAIYYLSALDHFIKEKLQIKYYVRYMDDFTLLHPDKQYLKKCQREIQAFLERDCQLKLNQKTQIFPLSQGVDFVGWHFYQTETGKIVRLLRVDSKVRRRRKNKQWMRERAALAGGTYRQKEALMRRHRQSFGSWFGHVSHGHSYHLRQKICRELNFTNQSAADYEKEQAEKRWAKLKEIVPDDCAF